MDKIFKEKSDSEKLKLIFDYIKKIGQSNDIENSLLILNDMGRDIVNAERCTIWLLDNNDEYLYSKVAHGVDILKVPKNTGVVGQCVENGEILLVNDPYNSDKFNSTIDDKTGFVTKSILVYPLYDSKNRVMGAIQALNKNNEESSFDDYDMEILSIASTFSANILETMRLDLEIKRSQMETINLLGELCEKRSLETGKHTARVSKYSRVIAEKLNMSTFDISTIEQAAALHDIGKLSIPDRILLKPGGLDDEEYKIMQKHSEVGFYMLKNSKSEILKTASIISLEHHERFNGKGYPCKLKGEEIDIYARIVALSDVFDAISSKRCYKDAWELEKCFDTIRAESGEHFDPKIVKAFFEGKDEIIEIFNKYGENERLF
ncbi:MAG: HD domain-containing phosphohydrolase [Lachnospirales bacterium]